ncbi:hypothetical protein JZK55_13590 [Dissulfurispira thermophila]|uniref:Uncharacterized protein n=2 Tax=root TaxID=1 RepID=A0A7G1H3X2_9BACT|nr:hypothetical protein [Dissulfurispira thermophila]BCB96437.1 hypothetical protein JZK55_13590 [Dissulfurispira thermophila]
MNGYVYHNIEEITVSISCLVIAYVMAKRHRQSPDSIYFMTAEGFFILSISSAIHVIGHVLGEVQGLLYSSLMGYLTGFASILISPFVRKGSRVKKYIPLIFFVILTILFLSNSMMVDFFKTRFSLWMPTAFLSSLLAVIYLSEYLRNKKRHDGAITIGFFLIAISSAFLFFPADVRSFPWMAGHIIRPAGFLILMLGFSMRWE